MTLSLNRRNAFTVARWSIGGRIMLALTLDGAALGNSGWIAVLMAGVILLPFVLLIAMVTRRDHPAKPIDLVDQALGPWVRRALCLVLGAFSIYELGCTVRLGVMSAQYVAFDQTPFYQLDLAAIVICAVACLLGGNGMAGGARVFRYLLHVFLIVLIIAQRNAFNWRWLTPILGPGLPTLLHAALSYAGMAMGLVTVWLCMDEEKGVDRTSGQNYKTTKPHLLLQLLLTIVITTVIVMVVMGMLTPVMPGAPNERDFAIDKLMANGLSAISLQFLLIVTWYMSQSILMPFYAFTAAAMLQFAFPKLKSWVCVLASCALGYASTLSPLSDRGLIDKINALIRLPVVGAIAVLICVMYLVKQRGKQVAGA